MREYIVDLYAEIERRRCELFEPKPAPGRPARISQIGSMTCSKVGHTDPTHHGWCTRCGKELTTVDPVSP